MTSGETPTLSDVARLAEVSPATVSRYLNTPLAVRANRRHRIEQAINELGYVPHGAARALASRRSRMIGGLFPSLDSILFGSFMGPLQRRLSAHGFTLVVASSNYDQELEYQQFVNLVSNGVDGIVLVGTEHRQACYDLLARKRIPYVLAWAWHENSPHPMIGFNNASAAWKITTHLLDLGHREFAMISGSTTANDRARDRVAGVRAALSARGLTLDDDLLLERPFDLGQGANAFRMLVDRPRRPTAIICGSDLFACGAVFEARRLGVDIPGDVSITGFDDTDLAASVTPALTTIRTPRMEMANLAASHLLDRLHGKTPEPQELDVELVLRESTAPPRVEA